VSTFDAMAVVAGYLALTATILLLVSIIVYLLVTIARWLKQLSRI
jgi:hypothetical protein